MYIKISSLPAHDRLRWTRDDCSRIAYPDRRTIVPDERSPDFSGRLRPIFLHSSRTKRAADPMSAPNVRPIRVYFVRFGRSAIVSNVKTRSVLPTVSFKTFGMISDDTTVSRNGICTFPRTYRSSTRRLKCRPII